MRCGSRWALASCVPIRRLWPPLPWSMRCWGIGDEWTPTRVFALSASTDARRNPPGLVLNARPQSGNSPFRDSRRAMNAADETRNDALLASFERAGYRRLAPAILQPAAPFLDLSGEDIRKRMYLTTDAQGRELCLRPDLTIPASPDYLAYPPAGAPP